jgi:hypothetical protein
LKRQFIFLEHGDNIWSEQLGREFAKDSVQDDWQYKHHESKDSGPVEIAGYRDECF